MDLLHKNITCVHPSQQSPVPSDSLTCTDSDTAAARGGVPVHSQTNRSDEDAGACFLHAMGHATTAPGGNWTANLDLL